MGLSRISQIGPVTAKALIERFGSFEKIFKSSRETLLSVEGVGPQLAAAITGFKQWQEVDAEVKRSRDRGLTLLTLGGEGYPRGLQRIADPPVYLYVKGELVEEDAFAVAIVGSRTPTRDGQRAAAQLAADLARCGVTVVSGLARGVDALAHRAALDAGGRTVAVLGNGLDIVYPPENVRLYKQIPDQGAVLSEFRLGTKPDAGNFPIRNRIISGLSGGVVVIEAAEKSGSLITAHRALDQGREVFAVPGSIYSRGSKGTNQLIQQGAKLVREVSDILEELFPERVQAPVQPPTDSPALSRAETVLLKKMGDSTRQMDELVRESGLQPGEVSEALLQLELKGWIVQMPGKMFARK